MKKLLLLPFFALALSGCDTVRETFGLSNVGPDEFAVATSAPLALPPDYTLRPPMPGAPRPQEVTASEAAAEALLGEAGSAAAANKSGIEQNLLSQAGVRARTPQTDGVMAPPAIAADDQTALQAALFGTPTLPEDQRPEIDLAPKQAWWQGWF